MRKLAYHLIQSLIDYLKKNKKNKILIVLNIETTILGPPTRTA